MSSPKRTDTSTVSIKGTHKSPAEIQAEYDVVRNHVGEALQRELDRLSRTEYEMRLEISSQYEDELQRLNAANDALSQTIVDRDATIGRLRDEKAALTAKLDVETYGAKRAREEVEAKYADMIEILRAQIRDLEASNEALADDKASAERDLKRERAAREDAERKADRLEASVDALNTQTRHVTAELEDLKVMYAELEASKGRELSDATARIQSLEERLDAAVDARRSLEDEALAWRSAKADMERSLSDEVGKRARAVAENEDQVKTLKFEISMLEKKLQEEFEARAAAERELTALRGQYNTAHLEAERLAAELERERAAHATKDSEKRQLEEKHFDHVEQFTKLEAAHGDMARRVENVDALRKQMEDDHATTVSALRDNHERSQRDLRGRVSELEVQVDDTQRNLAALKRAKEQEIASLESDIAALRRERDEVKRELADLRVEHRGTLEAVEETQALVEYRASQLAALQEQNTQLERELLSLGADRDAATAAAKTEATARKEAERGSRKARAEAADMMEAASDKISDLESQLAYLTEAHAKLSEKLSSTAELQAQVDDLAARLAAAEASLERERIRNERLAGENANLRDAHGHKDARINDHVGEIEVLKKERDDVTHARRRLEDVHAKTKEEMEKEVAGQARRIGQLEGELASWHAEREDWKRKWEQAVAAKDELDRTKSTQIAALRSQLEHENAERANLQDRLHKEVELRSVLETQSEAMSMMSNSPRRDQEMRALSAELHREFAEEKSALESRVSDLLSQQTTLTEERDYFRGKYKTEKKAREGLEAAKSAWEAQDTTTTQETITRLAVAQDRVEELMAANEAMAGSHMKEVNDVKIQLQIVTQEKEHLEDMLREEAHRRAEAEAAREVLERTQRDTVEIKQQRRELKIQMERIQAKLEDRIEALREEAAAAEAERDDLAARLRVESKARLQAESQVDQLQGEADRTDKTMLARVSDLQLQLADLRAQNEDLDSASKEEIQALKIQLSYARDQVRDLDRKLSQEVAARSALEASRDYAGADAH